MTDQPSAMRPERRRRVVFLLLPDVHVLDFAGPAQVFYEAARLGGNYEVTYCGTSSSVRTAQGLAFSELAPLPRVGAHDRVIVPGVDSAILDDLSDVPTQWLRQGYAAGATICSVCTGAFVLAQAGLLDGKRCTTHWKVLEQLGNLFPRTQVLDNRLFVGDGRVFTSAGVASGIDLALSVVERDFGPLVAGRVAREIVIYLRRDGDSQQTSIYLDHRTHVHPGVHRVQDWMINHPDRRHTVQELAAQAAMSPRNLTRVFKQATGVTIKEFDLELKLEIAKSLLRSPDLTIEAVASRCGYGDPRQLRRLWRKAFGTTPGEWKRRSSGSRSTDVGAPKQPGETHGAWRVTAPRG